jgi:hypothetical protein
VRQLRINLEARGVSPYGMARRTRPIVFADLVHEGYTFGNLYAFLRRWVADALAEAVAYVEQGRTRRVRTAIARHMTAEPANAHAWLRTLALELRKGG